MEKGQLVLLQETHWNKVDLELWKTMFPGHRIRAAIAESGRSDGLAGGVAIIAPPGWTLSEEVVIEGRFVAATARPARGNPSA